MLEKDYFLPAEDIDSLTLYTLSFPEFLEAYEKWELYNEIDFDYSRASIYTWWKKYILKGATALMSTGDVPRGKLPKGEPVSYKEAEQLKTQMQNMQQEIDILKEV